MPGEVVHASTHDQSLLVMARDRLTAIQQDVWATSEEPVRALLTCSDARAYYVADLLERFERELRRLVGRSRLGEPLKLELDGPPMAAPDYLFPYERTTGRGQAEAKGPGSTHLVPAPPSIASLRLIGAEQGRAHLFLEPIGEMVDLFAAQGAVAVVNAMALTSAVNRIRIYIGRQIARRRLRRPSISDVDSVIESEPEATFELDGMSVRLPTSNLRRVVLYKSSPDGNTTFIATDFHQ